MKTIRLLMILVMAICLTTCLTKVGQAASLGTAFTYQGHLYDNNNVANDYYDFQFKLYDSNSGGVQIGSNVNVADVDVIDGYFTVKLDFGDVFDANANWLQIGVRPGEQDDPNTYTTLTPLQEITPAPYALYAQSGTPGAQGIQGIQGPAGDSHWLLNGTATYYNTGNVGIGTSNPERILHIVGVNPRILIEASSISPEINFKNTGDSASEVWSLYKDGSTDDLRFYQNGNRVTIQNSTGNVGIGTIYPWSKLSVGGNGYSGTGIYGEGGDYGIYGFSTSGVGVYGINYSTYNEGMLGSGDYGVYGNSTSDYGVYGNTSTGTGVYGIHTTSGNYGYLADSNCGVYGYSSNYGGYGGVYGIGENGSDGVAGYSAGGIGVHGSSDTGYGVYGFALGSGGFAGYFVGPGYFSGNLYVESNVSAWSFTDRTPYPKDLVTAYAAVMSMERLPDGQYEENKKENQLDHSKLSSFIRSKDGNRDLSATVSCLNEVVKDLTKKNKALEKANADIKQLQKQNQILESRLIKLEASVAKINVLPQGAIQ